MGQTQTPEQTHGMDQGTVLPSPMAQGGGCSRVSLRVPRRCAWSRQRRRQSSGMSKCKEGPTPTTPRTVPTSPDDGSRVGWELPRMESKLIMPVVMFVIDIAGSREGALKGLSRMTGNYHVRFLGGRVNW